MRTLKLISRFYFGGLFVADFLITLSCVYLLGLSGAHAYQIIGVLFWYKLITIAIVFFTAVYHQKNTLYYYRNLGVSKFQIGIATFVADFLIWLVLMLFQLETVITSYMVTAIVIGALLYYTSNHDKK